MLDLQHYCQQHRSKFYKNEKDRDGQLKIWYSHKILNGQGFCTEKEAPEAKPETNNSRYMFMCNAMNNAVALASSGRIELDQIGSYYKRILSELTRTN